MIALLSPATKPDGLSHGLLRQYRSESRVDSRWFISMGQRKVRSPQGSMPANGRGESLKAILTDSATENIPPGQLMPGKGEKVR